MIGQLGSGKSSMLLAKLLLSAKDDQVDLIVFALPADKRRVLFEKSKNQKLKVSDDTRGF